MNVVFFTAVTFQHSIYPRSIGATENKTFFIQRFGLWSVGLWT